MIWAISVWQARETKSEGNPNFFALHFSRFHFSVFLPPAMATNSDSFKQSLLPSFLYSSSPNSFSLDRLLNANSPAFSASRSTIPDAPAASSSPSIKARTFMIPSPNEPGKKIEMYSPQFYAACTFGGILSCGLTHMAVTPLDLVKCNMQIDPAKYKSISSGFGVLLKEQGMRGFFRGWVPTLLGYSAQGACKFGFYEFFKKYYSDLAGPEYFAKYKTLIYLAGSASAEVIADVALCPFEAVKVRVQTQPGFARGLSDGLPKFVRSEGALGLYKGIVPLWGRQIPYTMMKFASFETIVEMIYKYGIPTPKEQCSKNLQLGVSFAGGYVAGVFCAIVSHPADNLVSFLNNAKGATVGDAVKKLGLWGLFTRGLPLRIVMIGTLTGAQWGIYDAFKVFVGLVWQARETKSEGNPNFFAFHLLSLPFLRFSPPAMAIDSDSFKQSLLPSFLYSSAPNSLSLDRLLNANSPAFSASRSTIPDAPAASSSPSIKARTFMIPSPNEPGKKIEMYSPQFYAACTFGGILSCGLTHMAVTPLDLVKCNMQILVVAKSGCGEGMEVHTVDERVLCGKLSVVDGARQISEFYWVALLDEYLIDPAKYKSISSGFGVLLKEQGMRGFFRGWVPTLLGYSAQGACKFGFYEFFKKYYSDLAGPEYFAKYKTLIYLAGSASAEVIADVALCPFEAVKVRVQTQPGFARGLSDGLPKFVRSEGALGLYKGIVPLWGRQIPCKFSMYNTMMKFASFETIVEMIYKYGIPTPKEQCSKNLQLGVSFAGGYVAGVFCAIVSHPADNLVSFLNNAKGATVGDAVKKLGLWGLFTRGLPLRIVMIGTLTGAQWGIYDAFKVFVGLPTTGGVAPAPAAVEPAKALNVGKPVVIGDK
ncbi:mitochondrial phosphate carrier protein 3, mitochondrial-like [Gossypium australe]|uniref:Mitochondrial phosphate carrier protein 3, mitochondrial-like n=2 Tax=Gossypium TaxID=3633 RepID=A0A5B6WLY2_9ROSI|nr:mitochondrial phosphate carrier protein 3, mitochondrial-like [Gossypium australe]